MEKLTVLYDDRCGFCLRCGAWLVRQPAYVRLELLPRRSLAARKRFPTLSDLDDELVVVADDRHVFREGKAWLACLYALKRYRRWSRRLATPALLPFARQAFHVVSENRWVISGLLDFGTNDEIRHRLQSIPPPSCPAPQAQPS